MGVVFSGLYSQNAARRDGLSGLISGLLERLFFRHGDSYCHESKMRKSALKPRNQNKVKREQTRIIILITNVFHSVAALYFPSVSASRHEQKSANN